MLTNDDNDEKSDQWWQVHAYWPQIHLYLPSAIILLDLGNDSIMYVRARHAWFMRSKFSVSVFMHCMSNGTACFIGKPMSVSSLPMTSSWHISDSAVNLSDSSGCCRVWMSCWDRLGIPFDMVRLRNCWTFVPNAFTICDGNPRACKMSVKRLNSELSLSDSLSLIGSPRAAFDSGTADAFVVVAVLVVDVVCDDVVCCWFIIRAKFCLIVVCAVCFLLGFDDVLLGSTVADAGALVVVWCELVVAVVDTDNVVATSCCCWLRRNMLFVKQLPVVSSNKRFSSIKTYTNEKNIKEITKRRLCSNIYVSVSLS